MGGGGEGGTTDERDSIEKRRLTLSYSSAGSPARTICLDLISSKLPKANYTGHPYKLLPVSYCDIGFKQTKTWINIGLEIRLTCVCLALIFNLNLPQKYGPR